ncbi:MAG: class I tRNA ligase family protein [Candidatus Paceibacterota bacterium]|jgi:cysteinyl-tRNA synthetase
MDLKLNLYTCGPTVYNLAHIGNLRAYIFADLVYRAKKFAGQNPHWVMNLTDVDDKTIRNTIEEFGKEAGIEDLKKYTEKYTEIFFDDLNKLNILIKEIEFIKVSEVIPQIQDFIVQLIEKGYAYQAEDGSTYFNIEKYQQDFGHYGALVGEKFLEGKKIGAGSTGSPQARVKVDEYEKDNLSDFALWKTRDESDANIFWSHPVLGDGRPGWHIECSVINDTAFKGETTDIHTGGIDLIFPHHTNEIAQIEALFGPEAVRAGKKFVNEWLHSEHLLVDGKKMAKSANNFYTLADLEEKGYSPLAYRYLLLQTSYKQKVNFTWASLESAQKGYENLKKKLEKIKSEISRDETLNEPKVSPQEISSTYLADFSQKISTLNTASALATLQTVLSAQNLSPTQKLELITKFDEILGLKLT